ncbi:MAG: ribosome-associated translation inhibitor RaiA [Candidatus Hydrogenedentes bacterium]|jgi:putative sigma-54 modulation protein|nr:ribosome-associated translation inhibitor RaiA [Candidatus Hydrogenedentota bacterium]
MNLTITGRHMEMTEALRMYIESQVKKLKIHFDKAIDIDVILDVEKHRHIAEVSLHANGVRIHSKEVSSDMYASLDTVMSKLEKQVRKYKDRINRHQQRPDRFGLSYSHAILGMNSEAEQEDNTQDSESTHHIVQREKLSMKPMTVDEAMMQLDLVDEPFLVFSNADTSQVNVLYTRENNTYGLIEPAY